jgi:hypothetical protein
MIGSSTTRAQVAPACKRNLGNGAQSRSDSHSNNSSRGGRLETLLALALTVLFFVLFPQALWTIAFALDVRIWRPEIRLGLCILVVFALFVVRFAPSLCLEWRRHQGEVALRRENLEKKQQANQRRNRIQQLRDARRRRMY